jgi:hypothetical protein
MTNDKKALAAENQVVGFRIGPDGRVDTLDEVEVHALIDCAIRAAMDQALRGRKVH